MTREPQDLDAVADAIVGPHAAARNKRQDEIGRRRQARALTLRLAAGVIAIGLCASIVYRYLH